MRRYAMKQKLCMNCFRVKGDFEVCPHCGFVEGTPPAQVFHLYPGTVLQERYLIGTVLGFGGFGITYKAWDSRLSTVVAIKEFFPSGLVNRVPGGVKIGIFSGDKQTEFNNRLERFLEEARNMAKFNREPNIVNIFDFFQENGTAYIVMEFLDGISIKEYLKKYGKIREDRAISMITDVMTALKTIHAQGIIHRDISPDNIFLTNDNQIKVLDFGAARFSTGEKEETLSAVIKPGYAPPEQYRSKSKQGPYTDIYATGATLYKMLTGITPVESIERALEDTLKKPSEFLPELDPALDKAIMKAMALKPEIRFQNIEHFRQAIQKQRNADFPEVEIAKRKRRRFWIAASSSCLVVVATVFIILFSTVLAPEKTLAEIPIEADTISLWLPVETEDQKAAFENIAGKFEEDHPEIQVELTGISLSDYTSKLEQAIASGTAPTVFSSDYGGFDPQKDAAPLSKLMVSINLEEDMFLSDYAKWYGSMREFPTGFRVLTAYANTVAAQEAGITLPDEVEISELLSQQDNTSIFTVSPTVFGEILYLADPLLLKNHTIAIGDNSLKNMLSLKEMQENLGDSTGLQAFSQDSCIYFLADTSMLRSVQESAPGYYQVLPLKNHGRMLGVFSNHYAVNGNATENQKNAGMLFLSYFLTEYTQNLLYLQSDDALPLNKTVLETYLSINSDFSYLTENMGTLDFIGEDGDVITRFSEEIAEHFAQSDLSEEEETAYWKAYHS